MLMSAKKRLKAVEVKNLLRSVWTITPLTEVNIAKVKKIVTDNPHTSLKVIACKRSVSYELSRAT